MKNTKKVLMIAVLYVAGTFVLGVVLFMALIFALRGDHKAMRQREEAIEYLTNKYNMEFNVSEEREATGPAFEASYHWEVTNDKYPNDSFEVGLSTKDEFSDDFYDVIFKDDITKYYDNIVKSYWSNVKVDVKLRSHTTNESYDIDDYNDYLSKKASTLVLIYLNYDDGFDYETEAEKIYNLLKEESKYSRDLDIFVHYIDSEQFNSKSIKELDDITRFESKEFCCEDIRTFNFDSFDEIFYKPIDEISVDSIVDNMKKSAEEVYEHNSK